MYLYKGVRIIWNQSLAFGDQSEGNTFGIAGPKPNKYGPHLSKRFMTDRKKISQKLIFVIF
jgi:hypothetical protein